MPALAVLACFLPGPLAQAQSAAPAAAAQPLDGGGWTFMLISLAFVWGLTFWSFKRVLSTPAPVDPGPAAKP